MDEHTRKRLIVGFITTWIAKLASSIIQFVQIPILFHYWTIQMNGEWMVLSAIPSYLSFSNIGFGSVAGNEMTMLMARGEQKAALPRSCPSKEATAVHSGLSRAISNRSARPFARVLRD